jgi:hypothetical protein
MHAIEHPSVNRLKTIPDIGQSPAYDHTHGRTYIGHHVSLLINFLTLIENHTPDVSIHLSN